jgi:hypothetical protein
MNLKRLYVAAPVEASPIDASPSRSSRYLQEEAYTVERALPGFGAVDYIFEETENWSRGIPKHLDETYLRAKREVAALRSGMKHGDKT